MPDQNQNSKPADEFPQQTYSRNAVSATPFHSHNGADSGRIPFLNLSDTPKSYMDSAGLPAVVNTDENMLEFSALTVPGGGTGLTSFIPYAVVTGGATSTGPLQQVSGLGTSGQLLTSNGSNALPTWQTRASNVGNSYAGFIPFNNVNNVLPTGWTALHVSTGVYSVFTNGNIASSSYGVAITVAGSTTYYSVSGVSGAGFTVNILDTGASPFDATFYFVVATIQ